MRRGRVNRGRESEDTGFRHHPARLFNWEIINARRPTGGDRARVSARRPAHSRIPRDYRYHGHPLQACRVAGRRNRSASRPGGRPGSRCKDPARSHERGLRRRRHARRLGLEGRLRSGRGRDGAVRPALRPPHAPRGRRRTGIGRRHARHAGDPGGAGAVPDKAVGGTACPATVLLPLAARLRRAASRRHPARRHRAGALGRHRHARRHGRMRPRQAPQWRAFGKSPAPERDRRRPRRVACAIVPRFAGHPSQRRVHRRLSAGSASHRGVDEPAVFVKPRGPAHPSRRGFAPPPFRLLHAPGGRAAGGDHVGRLHPGRCRLEPRLRASRSAAAHRLFHRHRRARLRTARHDFRYQAHRDRPRLRERTGNSGRCTGFRPHRRRVAGSRRRQCAATAGGRANCRGAYSGR